MASSITFINPECGSEGIDVQTNIYIKMCDSDSPSEIDISNITIDVDGHSVFQSGSFNCEFNGSYWYDGYDGYCYYFNFVPVTSYSADKNIIITAAYDDGYSTFITDTCSFTTECKDCLFETYIAKVRGASGLYSAQYTDQEQSDSNIFLLWNSTSTYPRLIQDGNEEINDVVCRRANENTYVGVAMDQGTVVIKNCISSMCYGGSDPDGYGNCLAIVGHTIDGYGNISDGYCTPYTSRKVYIDSLTNLYILNASSNRVEVFYNIEDDITGRLIPEFIYDSNNVTEIDGYEINNMEVIEYYSTIGGGSNTIILSTDNGVIRIDTDETSHGSSETNMNIYDYGIEDSSASYNILGGTTNRIVQTKYDRNSYLLAIASRSANDDGGINFVDMRVHVLSSYYSHRDGVENISYIGDDMSCFLGIIDVESTFVTSAFNVTFTVI